MSNDHTAEASIPGLNHQHHLPRANHQGLPRHDRLIAIALLRQSTGTSFCSYLVFEFINNFELSRAGSRHSPESTLKISSSKVV